MAKYSDINFEKLSECAIQEQAAALNVALTASTKEGKIEQLTNAMDQMQLNTEQLIPAFREIVQQAQSGQDTSKQQYTFIQIVEVDEAILAQFQQFFKLPIDSSPDGRAAVLRTLGKNDNLLTSDSYLVQRSNLAETLAMTDAQLNEKITGIVREDPPYSRGEKIIIALYKDEYTILPDYLLKEIAKRRGVYFDTSEEETVKTLSVRLAEIDLVTQVWIDSVSKAISTITSEDLIMVNELEMIQLLARNGFNVSNHDLLLKMDIKQLMRLVMLVRECYVPAEKPAARNIDTLPIYQKQIMSSAQLLDVASAGYRIPEGVDYEVPEERIKWAQMYPFTTNNIELVYTSSYDDLFNAANVLSFDFDKNELVFYSYEELAFLLTRRYTPDVDFTRAARRYDRFINLSEPIKDLIKELYNTRNETRPMAVAAGHPTDFLEPAILALDESADRQGNDETQWLRLIANKIGMHILPGRDNMRYMRDNILAYREVVNRSSKMHLPNLEQIVSGPVEEARNLLNKLTDIEIFSLLGIFINYDSRVALVNNLIQARAINFFYVRTSKNRPCLNENTIVKWEDTRDTDVFLITYGTIAIGRCHDIDDYLGQFRTNDITGEVNVDKPWKNDNLVPGEPSSEEYPQQQFTVAELIQLLDLLVIYSEGLPQEEQGSEFGTQLADFIEKIRQAIHSLVNADEYDMELFGIFSRLSNTEKTLLQDFLWKLFETGFRLRRWRGEPYKYPIKRYETDNIDNRNADRMAVVREYYESLKEVSPELRQAYENYLGLSDSPDPVSVARRYFATKELVLTFNQPIPGEPMTNRKYYDAAGDFLLQAVNEEGAQATTLVDDLRNAGYSDPEIKESMGQYAQDVANQFAKWAGELLTAKSTDDDNNGENKQEVEKLPVRNIVDRMKLYSIAERNIDFGDGNVVTAGEEYEFKDNEGINKLGTLYDRVFFAIGGEYCTNMANKVLILTAAHYLRLFFRKQTIDGFIGSELQNVYHHNY